MGKAVVATSIACEGIDVESEKHILIANTAAEFVYQITRLFDNNDLRVVLGKQARELMVEKYSWKIIAARLLGMYESFV